MADLHVLIKPVSGKCNMRCGYCFYYDVMQKRNQADLGIMTETTIKALVDSAFAYVGDRGSLNFVFQGGEPTLWGMESFQSFVSYVERQKQNQKVGYGLQTNGLLIDNQFSKFLAQHRFLVGLSLDGPCDMHNKYRLDRNGRGTYSRVLGAAQRLAAQGVDFNILSVITLEQARHPDKYYNFLKRNKITHGQLIPCINGYGGANAGESLDGEIYGKFLCRIFDLWLKDWEEGQAISLREFDNLAGMALAGIEPELCSMAGKCGPNAVIEADGSVYPCDFYVLDEWRLGNIHEAGLQDLLNGELERKFIRMSEKLAAECRQCNVLKLCRGGCRRLREPWVAGEPSRFVWCKAQKSFLPYFISHLDRLAMAIRQQQKRKKQHSF
ncbi:beta-defensin antibiotic precursor antimicrobial defensin beta signal defensin bd-32 defb-32 [Lucifera butyrica]|uniref:Beta-defensin antibiotic antimicrobial defensin beta signal defensin bd-32 defb-32 n=1 Tax=Lucifera butyrica TaxID=1351585 RepID=A0A498RC50_9FIRM|nr:SPASM domain-containing protein [Lucifera butyrica]VBB08819.1 beta-defensin antibiotic precursor antimicrobial defensin beta signal defensin bd-32 defb-32 [Lucifera butyrica]